MARSEFVLNQEYSFSTGLGGAKVLPAGSHVTPIEYQWIPKHCLEAPYATYFNRQLDTFAFTYYGITVIPRKYLREIC